MKVKDYQQAANVVIIEMSFSLDEWHYFSSSNIAMEDRCGEGQDNSGMQEILESIEVRAQFKLLHIYA